MFVNNRFNTLNDVEIFLEAFTYLLFPTDSLCENGTLNSVLFTLKSSVRVIEWFAEAILFHLRNCLIRPTAIAVYYAVHSGSYYEPHSFR